MIITLQLPFFLGTNFVKWIIRIVIIGSLVKKPLMDYWKGKPAKLFDEKPPNPMEIVKKKIDDYWRKMSK